MCLCVHMHHPWAPGIKLRLSCWPQAITCWAISLALPRIFTWVLCSKLRSYLARQAFYQRAISPALEYEFLIYSSLHFFLVFSIFHTKSSSGQGDFKETGTNRGRNRESEVESVVGKGEAELVGEGSQDSRKPKLAPLQPEGVSLGIRFKTFKRSGGHCCSAWLPTEIL